MIKHNSACRCGHDRSAHQHYRHGTDCSLCDCKRFRRQARRAKTITIQVLVPVDEYDEIMTELTDDIERAIQRQRLDYAPLEIRTGIHAEI
jgi:hypothetical protein